MAVFNDPLAQLLMQQIREIDEEIKRYTADLDSVTPHCEWILLLQLIN